MRLRLTPKMHEALRALQRSPIDYTPEGWFSRAGVLSSSPDGSWNTHTLKFLASRGLVKLVPFVTATLTYEGRRFLEERWAA